MQDKILLGFLMQGCQTGYAIKKQMEKSTNLFFNTSAGSIYPAFQKLEKEELVTKEERLDGGRAKKIYTITPKGKTVFKEWLNNDLPIGKIKQEALLRTFFFS
ncbi:MAG: PadR family transcriptional regulator, partial [Desulfobacterales bacterium]|nr:PadR family transcriptional regulator [Desulfobacterales bacterium]